MCRDYYCDVYCVLCTGQGVASNQIFELSQVYIANNIPQVGLLVCSAYVHMCVYMYVRTYVYMYVCMYVCRYVRMCVCTYVPMYVYKYVSMYVCMYVCM